MSGRNATSSEQTTQQQPTPTRTQHHHGTNVMEAKSAGRAPKTAPSDTSTKTKTSFTTDTATAIGTLKSPRSSDPKRELRRDRDKRRSLYHPASAAHGDSPPEVYWSEEGATPSGYDDPAREGRSYTFLREPTPEPHDRKKAEYDGEDGRGPGMRRRKRRGKRRRICGLGIWWVVLIALAVFAIALGVGLGVGLRSSSSSSSSSSSAAAEEGDSNSNADGDEDGDSNGATGTDSSGNATGTGAAGSTNSASTRSTPTTGSTTSTSRDPAFPTTTSSGSLNCPVSNNTLYAVPGSDKRFLRLCGIDFTTGDGAVDIGNIHTESMAECMRNCAGTFGCTGCGWGFVEGDEGEESFRCWMKRSLTGTHVVKENWEFALLQ